MNPIFHIVFALVLAKLLGLDPFVCTIFAALPDIDGFSLLFGINTYRRVHRKYTHSIFSFAIPLFFIKNPGTLFASFLGFISHLIVDLVGKTKLRLLWPLSKREFLLIKNGKKSRRIGLELTATASILLVFFVTL